MYIYTSYLCNIRHPLSHFFPGKTLAKNGPRKAQQHGLISEAAVGRVRLLVKLLHSRPARWMAAWQVANLQPRPSIFVKQVLVYHLIIAKKTTCIWKVVTCIFHPAILVVPVDERHAMFQVWWPYQSDNRPWQLCTPYMVADVSHTWAVVDLPYLENHPT